MVAPAIQGIDLFKIAGRSISGWIPSLKTGYPGHVRQPFCSQLEERLLMYLEYHPQVAWYARGDIGVQFATTYRVNPNIKRLTLTLCESSGIPEMPAWTMLLHDLASLLGKSFIAQSITECASEPFNVEIYTKA